MTKPPRGNVLESSRAGRRGRRAGALKFGAQELGQRRVQAPVDFEYPDRRRRRSEKRKRLRHRLLAANRVQECNSAGVFLAWVGSETSVAPAKAPMNRPEGMAVRRRRQSLRRGRGQPPRGGVRLRRQIRSARSAPAERAMGSSAAPSTASPSMPPGRLVGDRHERTAAWSSSANRACTNASSA